MALFKGANHSRNLQAGNCAKEFQLNHAKPREAKNNSYNSYNLITLIRSVKLYSCSCNAQLNSPRWLTLLKLLS